MTKEVSKHIVNSEGFFGNFLTVEGWFLYLASIIETNVTCCIAYDNSIIYKNKLSSRAIDEVKINSKDIVKLYNIF